LALLFGTLVRAGEPAAVATTEFSRAMAPPNMVGSWDFDLKALGKRTFTQHDLRARRTAW
tara:strand:- start:277 stop:456 length:180 start_codon:yes stop_codon:yes gene_type:complete